MDAVAPMGRQVQQTCDHRLLDPLARRFQSFAVVIHDGRRTRRTYRTPVNYFPAADTRSLVVALNYGPEADWAPNVVAGGGFIEIQGERKRISSAQAVDRSLAWPHLPTLVRIALRLLRVREFMVLETKVNTSL